MTIRCRDLVRVYTTEGVEVQALQGLDLDVASGELVALVGASGSGKSTLLGILSGHDRPTAGSVTVAGTDLTTMRARDHLHYRRRVVGFVWQQTERNLVPYLTVRENVFLAMQLGGSRQRERRAAELLELLGIGDLTERLPAEVSGGQRQRAAIAVGLANAPAVLLADEPTGELDEATSADVLETIRTVNRELGTTTLIVTHDPAVADHVERTVRISDGRTATEVLRGDRLIGAAGASGAQEYTVVDAVGRLQLPQEYVETLGLRDRVRVLLRPDHVGVYRAEGPDDMTDEGTRA
ncbi:ABC transporter ATP-binding protein [Curtobacterium sp. MCBD17_028]|uniref:ABC transporter ATP-binding protein n=1 Tax=Curtobacterium sp. MCBD17_028 TaxID=2175670 RepID=UPI000DA79457|nr:ABC transporter ATP-binding protein [Curtobacterium sp. MCBD17_028]PZE24188.1 ABC transporter ATP-binding protein [Curtobacterium sp. MCBD17_028]